MARLTSIAALCVLTLSHSLISGVQATTMFTIVNKCDYEVWPAVSSMSGNPQLSTTGFALKKNETKNITVHTSWTGRFWGRTRCSLNSTGHFSCLTGDCGSGQVECSGAGSNPPTTLAEFSVGFNKADDFYDVSLVDGYNIHMSIVPHVDVGTAHNCTYAGCLTDLNDSCPLDLVVMSPDGQDVIACRGACLTFQKPIYCCTGDYRTPDTCKPTSVSMVFKAACPRAYSYAFDDESSSFSCTGAAGYTVTFCPTNSSFISVPPTSPPPPDPNPSPSPIPNPPLARKRSVQIGLIIIPLLAALMFTLILIWVFVCIVRKRRSLKKEGKTDDGDEMSLNFGTNLPTRFNYEDLRIATEDFSKRIGRGGFGTVFEGTLSNGAKIAVKRLDRLSEGRKEFLAEVKTIGSIHHVNLVGLMGFCIENSSRLLVYEHMSNGSLDKWIFNKDPSRTLKWEIRKNIILDIAKGLAYLHDECKMRIAHLDVKPENVLLDDSFNAKLSDFGLARPFDRNQSHVITQMRGTRGYLAPEWLSRRITEKVDVYSFGIVVLEVICGRRNLDFSQPDEDDYLLLPTLKAKAEQNQLFDMVDSGIKGMQLNAEDEVVKMIRTAIWCLQSDYQKRPSMNMVMKVLEGLVTMEPIFDYNFLTSTVVEAPAEVVMAPSSVITASILSGPR